MAHLTPGDLRQLAGGGGERFVHFVDRLVRATAFQFGLSQSEIQTQLRVNIKDGGVDTYVARKIEGEPIGWFQEPTCWQFKACDGVDIDDKEKKKAQNELQKEIHKPHVEKLIKNGHGYRFCLLGDLTPEKVEHWEDQLKKESLKINPKAPVPRVIHGGHLLDWAERYPAIVAWLKHSATGVLYWEAWESNCHSLTPIYVPNPEWQNVGDRIRRHIDFADKTISFPCLAIGGAAGVGKTRLVFETLNEFESSPSMVLYATDDITAKEVAIDVANNAERSVILVADECSLEQRHILNEILSGHTSRVRVICLDNVAVQSSSPNQMWLSADQLKNTEEILKNNFAEVPGDRRRQYARLAGGFVRLAGDMCKHDAELASGDISAVTSTVEDYIRHRIPAESFSFLCLLALFHKVGYSNEVKAELDSLCKIAEFKRKDAIDCVQSVKETPGFVVQAGRYWYVSPEIVARVLFDEGWKVWGRTDPETFIQELPTGLRKQLIDRFAKIAGEEVRAELADFFRRWLTELNAEQLANPEIAEFAASVVEVMPQNHLPFLRSIICSASIEELGNILGHFPGAKWGPRRTLVWLLENLVVFPELFDDAEACLFALASVETEPNIANNATGVWRELFRVYQSGTATPFDHRLGILQKRLSEGHDYELVQAALSEILSNSGGKIVGRPIVAGRLRPSTWMPQDYSEESKCYLDTLILCREYILKGDEQQRNCVFPVLSNGVFFILAKGLLQHLSGQINPSMLSDSECRTLVNQVDEFIENHRETSRSETVYLKKVEDWIDSFRPSDFDGQLRSICSRDVWDRRFSSDPNTEDEMSELANVIVTNPSQLDAHLQWLTTPEARASELLGFRIGRQDSAGQCADAILKCAAETCAASLARGYVRGMVGANRDPSTEIIKRFDEIQRRCPEVAIDILNYGGDAFDALNRAEQLVSTGKVSAAHLATFAMGIGKRELTANEVAQLLPFFSDAARLGDSSSASAGLRFLETRLLFEERRGYERCLELATGRANAWELVRLSIPHVKGQHSAHEWRDIVDQLAKYEPESAVEICCQTLLSDSYSLGKKADELLQELASNSPNAVMTGLGKLLLDKDSGWRLQIQVLRDIISKLPQKIVLDWVQSNGVRGAEVIARHLPCPFIDENGSPVVPTLLDVILRDFNDDSVLSAFSAGVHSGESWWGNAADRFRAEADAARMFLSHDNEQIRKWAKREIEDRLDMARREDQEHAERYLPE